MMKLKYVFIPFCFIAAALVSGCSRASSADAKSDASVLVHVDRPGTLIPIRLFGSNLQWEHQGDGALDTSSGKDAWAAGLIAAAKDAGVQNLRFPGGALANTYRWKNGIGKRSARAKGLSYANEPIDSTFGTDELLRLAAATGTEPVITVNLAAGPQEAADWVEYMNGAASTNWGSKRVANGIAAPAKVHYWEIGNELYSPEQPGTLSAAQYAAQVKLFATAMKARDPSIKIGAILEASFQQAAWMKDVYPQLLTWNEQVIKLVGNDIDFVAVHFYTPYDKLFSEKELNELVWAGSDVFKMTMAAIEAQLNQYSNPQVEIALTEYSTFFGGKMLPDQRIASTENALFNAAILMAAMQDPRIQLADHWSLLNNNVFGMLTSASSGMQQRPTYMVFQELRKFGGLVNTAADVSAPYYSVDAKGNVPALPNVSRLQVASAVDADGKLRIAVVNRQVAGSMKVDLGIGGAGKPYGTLNARTWNASGSTDQQWSVPTDATLSGDGNDHFVIELPARSFTVINSN